MEHTGKQIQSSVQQALGTVSTLVSLDSMYCNVPDRERAVVVHREGARRSAGDEREGSSSGEALHGDSELRVAEERA